AALPDALLWNAAAHAIRGERADMEAMIAEAMDVTGRDDIDVAVGCAWGRCRAMISLLDENLDQAFAEMTNGADLLLPCPCEPAPQFVGLWPLLAAMLGKNGAQTAARVRTIGLTRHKMIGDMLGYADAILAGHAGRRGDAEAAFAAVDSQVGPLDEWFRHY